jgi:LPXTG-motif cell wall-anchored protein
VADGATPRSTFEYVLAPGAAVTDALRVVNYSERPLRVRVYAAEAVTTVDGAFDLRPGDEPARGAATWVALRADGVGPDGTLELAAREEAVVPFTLRVPADAEPGDHVAGLVAAVRDDAVDAAGNRVDVERRVGARVYTRVPGPVTAAFAVEDVDVDWRGHWSSVWRGEVDASVTVVNVGNVRLSGSAAAEAAGPWGRFARSSSADVPEVLPGQRVVRELTVPAVWPLVRLGVDVVAEPLRSGEQEVSGTAGRASVPLWAVPWLAVAGLALAALVAGVVLVRRRRRRSAGAEDATPEAGGRPPADQG